MMNADFIQKIIDLANIQRFEIDGREFTSKAIYPVKEPAVACLSCHTLTGLVDFFDSLSPEDQGRVMFLIEDYNQVYIVSDVFGTEKQREFFISAKAYEQKERFDEYMGHEDFMIFILSMFVQDETTHKILKIVGNLKTDTGAQYSDDGLTQTVTAKTGITRVENIELPNPITLHPYRTFSDIPQPESKFILRLKQRGDGIAVALFEADGAAWKNYAIANIKAYLENRKIGVKIIA